MDFKIRNIEFGYNTEGAIEYVTVRFDYFAQDGTNFNGSIRITTEEYETNSSNLTNLGKVVKNKFKAKIASM